MRHKLAEDVNVHDYSMEAAGRLRAERRLHRVVDAPQVSDEPDVVGLPNLLRGELELTTRTNSGQPAVIRVPHSILAVLVTVAIFALGSAFWVVSSVTEMKTNLTVIQQNQRQDRATYSGNLRLMVAYTTNETNRVEFMKGLLTPHQQQRVFEWEKANPKPPLPSTDTEPDERQQ